MIRQVLPSSELSVAIGAFELAWKMGSQVTLEVDRRGKNFAALMTLVLPRLLCLLLITVAEICKK